MIHEINSILEILSVSRTGIHFPSVTVLSHMAILRTRQCVFVKVKAHTSTEYRAVLTAHKSLNVQGLYRVT